MKYLKKILIIYLFPLASYAAPVLNYSYLTINNFQNSLYIPTNTTVNVFNSGWTAISGTGQLGVDGILNGMTVDLTGGVLYGTGTVNVWGQVANENGIVVPGSGKQAGNLTITGDYNQTNGTLLIPIDATGASRLIVGGTANLSGSLRGALLNGFTPVKGTQYTILTANSVQGQFTGTPAFITPVLFLNPQYTSNSVNVIVTRNYLNPFLIASLSANQVRVLSTLNNLSQRSLPANSDFNTVLSAFDALPTNQAVANALTHIEPISSNVLLNMAVTDMTYRSLFLNKNLQPVAPCFNQYQAGNVNVILAGNFYDGNATEGLEENRYDLRGEGEVLGISYALNSQASIGLLAQLNQARANLETGSTVDEKGTLVAPYFLYQTREWYANALIGYAHHTYHLNREIMFGTINRTATAQPDGNEWVSYVGAGYDFFPAKPWSVGPDVSLQYVNLALPGYTEQGANALDLAVASQNEYSLRSNLGGHVTYQTMLGEQQFIPSLSAAYVHEFANQPNMNFAFVEANNTNTSLSVQTVERNFLLLDAGFQIANQHAWRIFCNYTAQIDSRRFINGAEVEGRWEIN